MVTTRQATVKDLDQLALLFDQYRVFYKKETAIEQAKLFLQARIKQEESVIFVTVNPDDQLTGFVQLYPVFSSTRMKRLWLLNDLYVLETCRGQGLSVLLIDQAKEHCKNTDACGLMLETARLNQIGNQLYPKTGFVLDVDHNYYSWDA